MSGSDIQQYKYDEMSNKVVQNRKRKVDKDVSMPESLSGKVSLGEMGVAVTNKRNETNKSSESTRSSLKKSSKNDNDRPFVSGDSIEGVKYTAKSQSTQDAFNGMTSWCMRYLSDVSHETLVSATDALLEILKDDTMIDPKKFKECKEIISELTQEDFSELYNMSKDIIDYEMIDETGEYGDGKAVAIVFDSDEEQDDDDEEPPAIEAAVDEEEYDDDLNTETIIASKADKTELGETDLVPLYELDALWLQREVSQLYPSDAVASQTISEKAFDLLLSEIDTRSLEKELMELFDYENYHLVKRLIANRYRIVYRSKLSTIESEEHETQILEEIRNRGFESLLQELQDKGNLITSHSSDLSHDEHIDKKRKVIESAITAKRQPKIVDLDSLVFDQGPNMHSQKLTLPPGTTRETRKSYDIIHVPPPQATFDPNEVLVKITELPDWAQKVFPSSETSTLNRVQSKVYPTAFQDDANILLCAPTGAGKTNVAMLTALRTISNFRNDQTGQIDLKAFKIVYIAPLKALVQEQVREFSRRLGQFGIVVNELTGDSGLTKQQISETQIIVTTPEKWDVITRKSSDTSYTRLVRLIIIDEIHLLHDERGPVLESIVSRSLRSIETTNENIRLVGLSATLPNYKDVAKFLRVDKGLFFFDASFRPCPLGQQFIGIKEKKAIKKLQAMNEACYDKILEAANKYQVIIFVHSRKDTYKTAKWLRDRLLEEDKLNLFLKSDAGSVEVLKSEAEETKNNNLKDLLPTGFGIHHAGLNKSDRSRVEDLFAESHLQVLISTATLAWGVNLPAHTVIIKGTEIYNPEKGAWVQLSPQDILQMLGRAGRPRYDKSGEGIIITSQDDVQYYLAVLNQQLPIESQMMKKLADNLNAEIVLGTIRSREDAIKWLGYTYLYIRMLQSPGLYRVGAEYENDTTLYWKRADLVHSALTILAKNKLLSYNVSTGEIKSGELGRIASHYYIKYESMSRYNAQLKPWLTDIEVLNIFSSSGEFKYIPVRQEERMEIAKLLEKCPIPIQESETDPVAKVNVLLQSYISKLKLDGFALNSDMIYITQSAGRLFRAIYEICLRKKWANMTKIVLNLSKMVEKRMWLSNSPFRQFPNCPLEIIKKTESSQMPWASYFDLADPSEMAQAIRSERYGKQAFELLQQYPRVTMNCNAQPITSTLLRVEVEILPNWTWNKNVHENCEPFLLLVEDCDGEKILYSETVLIYHNYISQEHLLDFTVPITDPSQPVYFLTLISERWLNCEFKVPLVLHNVKVPKKAPSFTELLDLQPIPITDLKVDEFAGIFDFDFFNKFQSQTFHSLYNSNDNAFIGASKGAGKTACGLLAILNHWKQNKGRIIYISPNQEQINKSLKVWNKKLSALAGGKTINKLTGELTQDLSILGSSHLVLATPEQFDLISRRWRQRKNVQSIELFIADDCHEIGSGLRGAVYETIISRMNFIRAQLESGLRIVGLSTPLLNGRDFGSWLGCSKQNIYNFDPSERFRKIEQIALQSCDISHHPSMVMAMVGPTYNFIATNSAEGNTVVFVPTRKYCVDVSLQLTLLAESDGLDLLATEEQEIEPYLKKISDVSLQSALRNGIGFYYPRMSSYDKSVVERLFSSKVITVLLATKDSCYSCPSSDYVTVLGTQFFEGREHRYVDYPINEMLEMVGTASSEKDNSRVLILTNSTKLPYYNNFLNEALPIESFMNIALHDSFINEISSRIIKSQQDCIDWLTYTYFYRRLQLNPSFYGVKDTSHLGISGYLSELVESTLKDLVETKLIEVEEEEDVEEEAEEAIEVISPQNGAMIAAYYNVSFITMQTFSLSLNRKTKLKGILEVICGAVEFEGIPIRHQEESILAKLYNRLPVKSSDVNYESPSFKTFILLQAHFSRVSLPPDLASDQQLILDKVLNLLYACVDFLSGEGWLNALSAMDLSQMIVQAVWESDSPLKQVPYFDRDILKRCKEGGVDTVYDIMTLEDDARDSILQLDNARLTKVADFVNKYPNIDVSYKINLKEAMVTDEPKEIIITLQRDEEVDDLEVVAPFYPSKKTENWWVVIGDSKTRQLYGIKRTTIPKESQEVKLEFSIPVAGHHDLTISCICDSYIACDAEASFEVDVEQGESDEEEE